MNKNFKFFVIPAMILLSFSSCGIEDDGNLNDEDNNQEQLTPVKESDYCAEKSVTFGETNGVEYVDLDLPSGNLWATMNIGADENDVCGNYYAWGETSTKNSFDINNYVFYKDESTDEDEYGEFNDGFTKYVVQDNYHYYGFKKFADNKVTLDLSDDVAHVTLGGSWRIPTQCDFEELKDNCKMKWTSYQGVQGYKFTASNGNSIFMPASGNVYYDRVYEYDHTGCYWTSTLYGKDSGNACYFFFTSSSCCIQHDIKREIGNAIRAVCPVKK